MSTFITLVSTSTDTNNNDTTMTGGGDGSTAAPVVVEWKHGGSHVLVAGSFSQWRAVPMLRDERDSELWKLWLILSPGVYPIKFVVDGSWCCDEDRVIIEGVDTGHNTLCVDGPVVTEGTKTLFILRGPSGSGKSTKANKLIEQHGSGVVFEADQRMVDSNGNYAWDPKKLTSAHAGCQRDTEEAMQRGESLVIVSNTATQYWEMFAYVKLAHQYSYDIRIEEADTDWKHNAKILSEKNSHNVPLFSINSQLDNFNRYPTLPSSQLIPLILSTGGFRPSMYRPGFNLSPSKTFFYYGIRASEISHFINLLTEALGKDTYERAYFNRCQRDGGVTDEGDMYHITLTGFDEHKDDSILNKHTKADYFSKLKEAKTKPRFLGVGKTESEREGEGDVCYYVVVEWSELNEIREKFSLNPLPLHVTLGFLEKDVHNVLKGPETIFLK